MTQTLGATPRRTRTETGGASNGAGTRQILAICTVLLVVAAVPRLSNLTGLGFHGDEDITAFAVQSAVETGEPQMPSGMPYLRGLPYTWLTAGSVALFGDQDEAAFRLPGAVFGILTVPLLFLLGRRLAGTSVALVAALLLALSQWHIYYSLQARMYSAFLFFFVAAAFAILTWLHSGRTRHVALALALSLMATSLHLLGTLLVFVFAVPYLTGKPRVRWPVAGGGAAAVGGLALLYDRLFVVVPYGSWSRTRGELPQVDARPRTGAIRSVEAYLPDWALVPVGVLVIALAASAAWLLWRITGHTSLRQDPVRRAAVILLGGAAAAFVAAGQLYGAAVAALLMLVTAPDVRSALVGRARAALGLVGIIAAAWAMVHAVRWGPYAGLKAAAIWPYALPIHLTRLFVVPMLIFVSASVWLALRPRSPHDTGVRTCVQLVWLQLLGLGLITFTHATRYLIELYPFILLAVAAAVFATCVAALQRFGVRGHKPALVATLVVAVSGLLSGHGLPQAVAAMSAGPGSAPLSNEFAVNPDHRGAALWLAERKAADDIVIAEDQLALRWYGVPVDFWLRRSGDALRYLYRDAEGVLRDFYGRSALLADSAQANEIVAGASGRVWLVTSAETYGLHHWYLSSAQRVWLDQRTGELEPAFTAGDGLTSVYCLNCGF